MLKKVVALVSAISLLGSACLPDFVGAVSTNGSSNPWTMEKAEQLARKAYFSATPENITALYQAGSASAAVNIVFPDQTGPDRTQFNSEIATLTGSGFNWGDGTSMNRLYQYRYARDPYESKAKLFSLFEDIFPVNQSDRISYKDIIDQHDLLYSNTLGNYRTMIKRNLYNNGGMGDFASGKFLDLLDQQNKNSPNENYGRELIQLFMMGEYQPGESKENGDTRNYEESDVAGIARILTGFVADPLTHQVSYDSSKHNTSTGVLFLSGALKPGVNFSFVNGSGALDLADMANPINGNNGIADNAIDYIFAMRENAIALFLADRIYRFYAHDKPTRAELDVFAAQIVANNFDILPSVKWFLASDMMYSDAAMNGVYYKNPLELTIGTIKLLHKNSPNTIDPMLRDGSLLSRFNWTPYFPGSVFGRDGFDDNAKFYSSYIQNQWISYTSRIAFDTSSGSYLLPEVLQTTNRLVDAVTPVMTSTGNTYSGSLAVASGTLNLTIPNSQTGVTLNLAPSNFVLPTLTLVTASGTLNIRAASYNPAALTLSITDAEVRQGTGTTQISSGNIQFATGSSLIREITTDELFAMLESRLLLGRTLPAASKVSIATYLNTNSDGTPGLFKPSTPSYQANKIRSVIEMILAQPEFVLQTGFDRGTVPENLAQSVLNNPNGKLLFVELGGGYDWLHGIVPKNEYADYVSKRTLTGGTIGIDIPRMTDIGDFYMNSALAYGSGGTTPSLKSLYDSNNLRIFNRVGTPKHSRDHDQAQKQIASYASTTLDDADGVFGQLIRYEPNSENTISLSGRRPNVFRGGRYINIGPSGAIFSNNYLNQTDRNAHLNTLRTVMQARSYPDRTSDLFKSAVRVDEIAQASKLSGGPDGAGYGNINNLKFLRTLMANNVGKSFYMQADGGYDTHSNQLAPQSNFDPMNIPKDLNYNIGNVMSNLTTFFNDVKSTQNITIVVFSEFGRTIKVNGDLGTDHGEGGGMFVLSNNPSLLSSLDQKVYGNISVTKAKDDWLGVGIDYRSVYGKIYKALYGVSDSSHFGSVNDLARDVSTAPAKIALSRYEYRANNDNNVRLSIKMKIEGQNYDSDKAGYIQASRLKNANDENSPLDPINNWEMDNYAKKPNNTYDFSRDWINEKKNYKFSYRVLTNQYTETANALTTPLPDVVPSNMAPVVTGSGNLVFRRFENTAVSTSPTNLSGSGIVLANTMGTGALGVTLRSVQGIEVTTGTGLTNVTQVVTSSGSTTWYGGYVMGDLIDPAYFISEDARITTGNVPLSGMNVEKIAKIGADTLGVGMQLNRSVRVTIPATANKEYRVITSEDGLVWSDVGTGALVASGGSGKVSFDTDHFSYFALVIPAPIIPPTCTISASATEVLNGNPVTLTWSSQNALSATLSGRGSQPVSGSVSVTPPNDTGTSYVLNVVGGGNTSASCQIVVTAVGYPTPPTPPSNSGGGGGGGGAPVPGAAFPADNVFTKDVCPKGDTSPSLYDGRCDVGGTVAVISHPIGMTNGSVLATPTTTLIVPNSGDTGLDVAVKPPVTTKPTTNVTVKPVKPTSTTTKPATSKPAATTGDTTVTKPTVSVAKPVVSKPIAVKPAETAKPATTVTPVTTVPPVSFKAASVLDGLVTYTGSDFDSYDWSAERRLPTAIFQRIDAKLEEFKKTLDPDRSTLQAKLAMLQDEITARLKIATSQREIRILKYVQTEITIMQELYRRPR